MTAFVVVLIGAGALLMISAMENTSLGDTFNSLWAGTVPSGATVDVTQTPRWQYHPPRNVS